MTVDREILETVNLSTWPAELDLIDAGRRSESEMEPAITRPIDSFRLQNAEPPKCAPSRGDHHGCSDPVAVGPGALQSKYREMRARGLGSVVKVHRGFVMGSEQGVDAAIVVQVANGQALAPRVTAKTAARRSR